LQDTPEPQPAVSGPFGLHEIFVGADGLRAGWGLLLFVVLWESFKALVYPLVLSLITVSHDGHAMHAGRIIPLETAGVVCVLAAMWVLSRIEGRSVLDYGLKDTRALRHFAVGALCGAVLLSCLVLCLKHSGALVFDGRQLFCWAALRYSAVWLFGFLVVGLLEELLFRGYAQFTIARGVRGVSHRLGSGQATAVGFWTAALLTSFYFGFGHGANPGESSIGLTSAGLIGLVFCLSIWRTGSLWWAIGCHMAWDWAESFLYGVGDSGSMIQGHLLATHPAGRPLLSGGATGPEGSLLVLPVIALAACAAVVTVPRRRACGASAPYVEESAPEAAAPSLH
jgi:membrane protease YdiL (CAAX protease family)